MRMETCSACGAVVSGLVCLHCGQYTSREPDIEQERTALKELHHWLGEADKKKAAKLLRAAFLPNHPDLLVDYQAQISDLAELVYGC